MYKRNAASGVNTTRREWVFKKMDMGAQFRPQDPETFEAIRLFKTAYNTLYYDRIYYRLQKGDNKNFQRIVRAKWSNYSMRAKKYGVSNDLDFDKLLEMYLHSNGKCTHCHIEVGIINLVPDHIRSMYKGGPNTIDNIQLLCEKCNTKKGHRDEYK